MSFIKFISSRTFLYQILLAIVAVILLCFLALRWLNSYTNNGSFETVPNLIGKSLETAEAELNDNNLVMKIQDSANFNPKYPRFSVIEQDPVFDTQVKENRKIYLTLNPSGYRKLKVPNVRKRTYRQAKPTLEALGFKIGKITYRDYLGKDEVIDMRYKGSSLKKGAKLEKTSTIDLVLGNGKRP